MARRTGGAYRPAGVGASDEIASASAQVRYRQRAEIVASEQILDGMARQLERIVADLAVEAGRRDPDLEKARFALDQAAADLPRPVLVRHPPRQPRLT